MPTDGAPAAACPPGWSYDPSTWAERLPLVALAGVGGTIATYLALYQSGVFRTVWEPFFGRGSVVVLHSPVSRLLPIPDAALGALGYLVDAVSGVVGGEARWRTMPWIVIVFGVAVGPLGAVSLALVVMQPVLFHAWCTLCLASALVSVAMIGPAMDELLASLQLLARERAGGRSVWHAFWRGGAATPATPSFATPPAAPPADGWAGRWARAATVALGAWTMAAPAVLGLAGAARTSALVVGPLAVATGIVATSDVTRAVRWLGVALGAWLVVAALTSPHVLALVATGLALAALATVRGARRERVGGGWRSLAGAGATDRPR